VQANQECQSETLGIFAGHQPSFICIPQPVILPRNQTTQELGGPQLGIRREESLVEYC
jgi:hypothetical protein